MRRALILIALAGCTEEPAPSGPNVTSHVATREYPARLPNTIDLLFVTGDIGARNMSSLGTALEAAMPGWFDGFVNLRVKAGNDVLEITTDVRGNREQNFTGAIGDALVARLVPGDTNVLARVQSQATSFPDENNYLGVFTITASDDTSPDADYATMLKATKTDPANVLVSGIYAQPAQRLDAFHAAFPNRATYTSIDETDYAHALEQIGQLQKTTLGLPCVELPLDLDPTTPGDQFDCDVSGWDDGVELARIPLCTGADPTSGTCWEVVVDAGCSDPAYGVFRMRGLWRRYHPQIRWQCVVK